MRCEAPDVLDVVRGLCILSRWVTGGLYSGMAGAMSEGT